MEYQTFKTMYQGAQYVDSLIKSGKAREILEKQRKENKTIQEIADDFGVSRQTVYSWLNVKGLDKGE